MRASRGRIDRAIRVEASTLMTTLGRGEPMRVSALNEAWAQLYEALQLSGGSAVVSRLVRTEQAQIKWAVVTVADPVAPAVAKTYGFDVSLDPVDTGFALQVKHLGCHNDGIKLSLWVEPIIVGGVKQPSKEVVLRILDADNESLYFFRGSTDPLAKDDYGRSLYLPDVVRSMTDEVEIKVAENLEFLPDEPFYGYGVAGEENIWLSPLLLTFTEGDQAYEAADYDDAIRRLRYSPENFSYLVSGGSRSSALLSRLALVAHEMNVQFRFDVPGDLPVESAIAFTELLNLSGAQSAHLMQAFWMPVISDDLSGVNPRGHIGAAALHVALTCRRNAATNASGMAAKHYPIAGRSYPVPRSGLRQVKNISERQLSDLARARINPVLFDTFNDGSYCVFRDQITQAPTRNSLRMLISVVEMSTAIDDFVVRFGKSLINAYPMTMAVSRMSDFLNDLFAAAEATGWLIPSAELGGKSYRFTVAPRRETPYDKMDVTYALRYDGAVRQITVTQILSK